MLLSRRRGRALRPCGLDLRHPLPRSVGPLLRREADEEEPEGDQEEQRRPQRKPHPDREEHGQCERGESAHTGVTARGTAAPDAPDRPDSEAEGTQEQQAQNDAQQDTVTGSGVGDTGHSGGSGGIHQKPPRVDTSCTIVLTYYNL